MPTQTTSSSAVSKLSYLLWLLFCVVPASVQSTPMLPFDGAGGGVYMAQNRVMGYQFEVFSPILLEGLGVFDVYADGWPPSSPNSSGNVNVRLWTEGARFVVEQTVTPTSTLDGTTFSVGGITGAYRYQSLELPILLTEGIYRVGAELQDLGGYNVVLSATPENLPAAIGNLREAYGNGDYQYPDILQDAGEIHMGGSILYEDAPAGTIDDPILPLDVVLNRWTFAPTVVSRSGGEWVESQSWFDPEIAVGYEYTVADARFGSVELPFGFGDDRYEVWLVNPASGQFEFIQWLDAGVKLDLSGLDPFGSGPLGDSVDTLRILGIETSELLDPTDSAAFPTGLTFQPLPGNATDDSLIASLTMQALTETVGDAPVPTPSTVWLLSFALLGIWKCRGSVTGHARPGIMV